MVDRSERTKVALSIIAFSNLFIGTICMMELMTDFCGNESQRLASVGASMSGFTGLLLAVVGLVESRSLRGGSGNVARGLCLGNGIMVFVFVLLLPMFGGCLR